MVARGPEALAEPTHTTCPAVRRLRGLSAVPCHGTRELRGQATAAVKNTLNQYKVDREERPYIDAFYMGSLHIWRAGRMAADDVPGHEARPFWAGHLTPETRWANRVIAGLREVSGSSGGTRKGSSQRRSHNGHAKGPRALRLASFRLPMGYRLT